MAQQHTRPDLHAAIEQRFPDNTNEEITPERLRDGLHELVDSAFLPASDKLPAAQVTAQLLGLDPATGEFLVLLSPSAPTTLNRYTLATYPAGSLTTSALPVGTSIASRLLRLPASVLNQTLCLLDTASQPVPLMVLELKADEDGRFDLLTPDDRALPQSAIRGLIDWHYEESDPTQPWTLKPGRSVMFTRSRQLVLNSDVQEGDVFSIYINPFSPVSRVELAYFGGIDEKPTKRYLPGTSLALRYTYIADYNDASGNLIQAHYGLRTLEQNTLTATNFRGAYSASAYYVAGDFVLYKSQLYLRLTEGGGNGATFDPTKWVGGGASGPALRTTAQDDAFVDPTYNIAASYLNTALTIRTYAQASVAVTLPALTAADVPALLRVEHQSGIGGTTCLLTVPGLARPLRVGEYALLAATATPGIPANPNSGAPAIPPGTAWVVLNASAQQLEPLAYPVMVATRSLGYAGYPTLEAAALGAPFRSIVVNVPQLVISQNVTLTSHLYAPSLVQIRIEDGVTVTLSPAIRLHNIQFLRDANGTGKVILASNASTGATPDANQAVQLIDSRIGPNLLFSAVSQAITLRGQSALDNATGSPGTIYLYDTATAVVAAGGPTVENRRPGTSAVTTLRPNLRVSNATSGINNAQQQQPINNTTFTKVTGFTAVEREVGSTPGTGWEAANQRYIVPLSGEYQVGAVGQLQPGSNVADAVFYLMVYVNSQRRRDLFLQGCPSASAYYGGSGTTDLTLQAGDIVEIYAWQNGGSSQLIQSDTRCVFSIRQLPS
jgi:hypothetical protein